MMDILNIVLPVFLLIGAGHALGLKKLLSEETSDRFSWFVFYVSAPALLFRSAAVTPVSESINPRLLGAVAAGSVLMAFITYLAGARLDPARRGVFAQGAFRSNMVFVGLPVIVNAYGDSILGPASILIGFTVPLYNLLAVMVLSLPHRGQSGAGPDWSRRLKDVALNPLILSSAAGLLVSFLEIPLPGSLDKALDLLGGIAMPLALVVVGASLDFKKLSAELMPAALVSFLKLIIYPALVFALLRLLGESGTPLQMTVLLMACPTAVVSHIMSAQMKGDQRLSASIVIGTTIFSLATITGWLILFQWRG